MHESFNNSTDKKMSHVGFEPLAPGWKNHYKAGALTLTPSRQSTD